MLQAAWWCTASKEDAWVNVFSPSPILVGSVSPIFKPPSEPDVTLH